jgi:hypothetical protein
MVFAITVAVPAAGAGVAAAGAGVAAAGAGVAAAGAGVAAAAATACVGAEVAALLHAPIRIAARARPATIPKDDFVTCSLLI